MSAFFRPVLCLIPRLTIWLRYVCAGLLIGLFMLPGTAPAAVTEDDVMALQDLALSGERAAVDRLFVLYADASGAVKEDIDDILGKLTRQHPQLLLEAMQRSQAGHGQCVNLGNTVDLTDQITAQIKELNARRAALLTVQTPELIPLRDTCVRDLAADLRTMRNAEQDMRTLPQRQD